MNDRFNNRLAAFGSTLQKLDEPDSKLLWENQPPLAFGTKVALTRSAVADLRTFCENQGLLTTGVTLDKAREEAELEEAGHELGSAAADFFLDQNDEAAAAQVEFPLSQWRRWSGNMLLAKARVLQGLIQAAIQGPDAAEAATYGLNAAAVARLKKEADDYELVLNAPDVAIGNRAALTRQMRTKFAEVEKLFTALDRLVVQFGKTAAGKTFVEAYFKARQIIDRGHGPQPPDPAPPVG